MKVDTQSILQQMDAAIQRASRIHENSSDEDIAETNTSLHSIIHRFTPPGNKHRSNADNVIASYSVSNGYGARLLMGILKALRADYATGNLSTIEELIHADLFSDFLEMADHLLSEGYKDPSAVIAGSVLEEHLRKLASKSGIAISKADGSPKKADALNSELAGNSTISKLDQKNVTAWLGLRNDAAHGNYSKYTREQVSLLVSSIRDFLTRNPA